MRGLAALLSLNLVIISPGEDACPAALAAEVKCTDRASGSLQAAKETLAAGYRLSELFGHGDLAAGFFSARSPVNSSVMLVAEHGLHFGEVRASDIVEVDIVSKAPLAHDNGRKVNGGATQVASAVYRRHPDVHAFVHSHPKDSMALAALADPRLMIMTEPSFMFYERIAYTNADFFFEDDYANATAAQLDGQKFVVFIRNHAIMVAGKSVPQAFYRAYMFDQAAGLQLKALASGAPLREANTEEAVYHRRSCEEWEGGFDGGLEWPGLLRRLDRDGADYKM